MSHDGPNPAEEAQELLGASPLKSAEDALVVTVHAILLRHGFHFSDGTRVLPEGWNTTQGMYTFTYKHDQSSMTFDIKIVTMADKLLLHGVGIEDKKVHSLEIKLDDFIDRTASHIDANTKAVDLLQRVEDLTSLIRVGLVYHLVPGAKEGFEAEARAASTTGTQTTAAPPSTLRDDRGTIPRQPEPFHPGGLPGRAGGPRSLLDPFPGGEDFDPLSVGRDDLLPSGPGMPGFAPRGGGGGHVGPDHPIFGNTGPRGPGWGRGGGGPLGPGRLPGARFDPYGPPGTGFEPFPDHMRPPGPPGGDSFW